MPPPRPRASRPSPTTPGSWCRRSTAPRACVRPASPARVPPTRENLQKLLDDMRERGESRGGLRVRDRVRRARRHGAGVRGALRGPVAEAPRGDGGFGYDPVFVPADLDGDERTMAELSREQKDAISHRGRADAPCATGCLPACEPRAPSTHRRQRRPARVLNTPLIAPDAVEGSTKFGAARLSVVSNSILIALKVVAGAITGSIAIITEAVHSSIDLLASIVAYLSLRKADEPADAEHMYGHAKVENLAAAIEGMLILVGAGVIIYEAVAAAGGGRRPGREHRRRHRRDRGLGGRQPRGLHLPVPAGARARLARARGRRRPPARRRGDVARRAAGTGPDRGDRRASSSTRSWR